MSENREGLRRDVHISEAGARAAGIGPDTESSSATFLTEATHRESMQYELMRLAVWLSENPKMAKKNLKPVRGTVIIEPGVYYNAGIRMIERLYKPQHAALGNRMFRVSRDPATSVEVIRRKVLEGKN